MHLSPFCHIDPLSLSLGSTRARARLPVNTAVGLYSARQRERATVRGARKKRAVVVVVVLLLVVLAAAVRSERSQVHIRRGGRERRAFAGERSTRVVGAAAYLALSPSFSRARPVCSPPVRSSSTHSVRKVHSRDNATLRSVTSPKKHPSRVWDFEILLIFYYVCSLGSSLECELGSTLRSSNLGIVKQCLRERKLWLSVDFSWISKHFTSISCAMATELSLFLVELGLLDSNHSRASVDNRWSTR